MDLKWLIIKVGPLKGCNDKWVVVIGWSGYVSHNMQSLLGAIDLTILCAFVCKVGRLQYTNKGVDLLATLGKCSYLFTRNKFTKKLAFLIILSTPTLKNIAQISSH